jgi:hypothetical protein
VCSERTLTERALNILAGAACAFCSGVLAALASDVIRKGRWRP